MKKYAQIAFLTVLSGLVLLTVFWLRQYYDLVKEELETKAVYLFRQAMEREKSIMHPEFISFSGLKNKSRSDSITIETVKGRVVYNKQTSTDDLTQHSKNEWEIQLYISHKNPSRAYMLDSLFQNELGAGNILAQSAVRFSKGDSLISCSDETVCRKGIALKPVVFGKEDSVMKVELQAYVLFSFLYMIRCMPLSWGIATCWGIAIVFLYIRFLQKKKKVAVYISQPAQYIELVSGVQFCAESGQLKDQTNIIYLKKYRLALFIYFLDAPDRFLNNETICREILHRPLEADESVDKNKEANYAIMKSMGQTITRLRKDLAAFPFIQIKAIRGNGYRLIISEPGSIKPK